MEKGRYSNFLASLSIITFPSKWRLGCQKMNFIECRSGLRRNLYSFDSYFNFLWKTDYSEIQFEWTCLNMAHNNAFIQGLKQRSWTFRLLEMKTSSSSNTHHQKPVTWQEIVLLFCVLLVYRSMKNIEWIFVDQMRAVRNNEIRLLKRTENKWSDDMIQKHSQMW